MAMKAVFNPTEGDILDLNGMFVGKIIYVYGKTHEVDNARIAVNLICGASGDDDIALHVNPRFEGDVVVRNTRRGGGWEQEEREGEFPFRKPGHTFGIWIICRSDCFEIRCNRYKTFATYTHRIPFTSITHVQVSQNCDVKLVCSDIKGLDVPLQIMEKPSIPLNLDVPFHNIRGHSITVVGKPTSSDGRFAINFKDGDKTHFHFNPRMNENQIVRNTSDGGWGEEERGLDIPFPFVEGVPFQVKIRVEKDGFKVDINGCRAFSYSKRVRALKGIRDIVVQGDVELESVTVV